MLPEPRDYQRESISRLRKGVSKGLRGQVLSSPTGSGKTVIAMHMLASAMQKGSRALFVVDGIDLLDQTSARLFEAGLDHGIIGGGRDIRHYLPLQVCMMQTLARRGWPEPEPDIVFIDECHQRYRWLADHLPECPYIGLTATAMTKGLGEMYGGVVQTVTTNQLIEQANLVSLRVREAVEIDMAGAPVSSTGEWSPETVHERGSQIIGDIVSTWVEETQTHFGGPVKTMLFSASIAHGEEICREFQKAGHDFRQVSAYDKPEERKATMDAFRHGEFPGVVSVAALGKGIDIPDLQCLVIARPFRKAFAAHIQMLGRGMRTSPGKDFCLVLDHSANVACFYDATTDFYQHGVSSLDDGKWREVKRADERPKDANCKKCGEFLPPGADLCPVCGHERKRRNMVETVPGRMVSLDMGNGRAALEGVDERDSWEGTEQRLWEACCASVRYALERHGDLERARRQASGRYRDLAGKWPPRTWAWEPGNGYVPKAIERRIRASYEAWKRKQGKGGDGPAIKAA